MPDAANLRPSDPLSDVLSTLRLRGNVLAATEARSPWAIAFPPGEARFHVIERGDVFVTVAGVKKPVRAVAGDLLVLPHGTGHTMGDRPERKGAPLSDVVKRARNREASALRVGEAGSPDTNMICGTFELDLGGREALLSVLPPVLHTKGRSGKLVESLDLVMRLFSAEAHGGAPGSAISAARLIDLILVQAIRSWLAEQPTRVGGWLGAMRDPQVGAALTKLHADPARDWTVDALAALVGLSRSPLAARFTALVGEPPLRYLTRWRMHLAAQKLRRGISVRETAEQVGYESEAAFSRTFKRYMGSAPVKFRGSGRLRGGG